MSQIRKPLRVCEFILKSIFKISRVTRLCRLFTFWISPSRTLHMSTNVFVNKNTAVFGVSLGGTNLIFVHFISEKSICFRVSLSLQWLCVFHRVYESLLTGTKKIEQGVPSIIL